MLKTRLQKVPFRKEDFEILFHYYQDLETGEEEEDDETVRMNELQAHNQYRAKYNLPFPNEIKAIRVKYGISAAKMSEILGFGTNQYRNYEKGEIPSLSNGRLIQMINDPEEFRKIITLSEGNGEGENQKLKDRVEELIQEEQNNWWRKQKTWLRSSEVINFLVGSERPSPRTGYVKPSLEKFCNMVSFFALKTPSFKTKVNKLMFYADFLNYKKSCFSISGAQYRAIQYGPVPLHYQSLYDFAAREEYIRIEYITFDNGDDVIEMERHVPSGHKPFDKSLFTEMELETLYQVAKKFKKTSTKKIVDISHEEEAWKEYLTTHAPISYQKAFNLKAL